LKKSVAVPVIVSVPELYELKVPGDARGVVISSVGLPFPEED
jgi:hypothetical protein